MQYAMLKNSYPPVKVGILRESELHVIIVYSDFRSSLLTRDDFEKFFERI